MNHGMKVKIKFSDESPYMDIKKEILRNITEIHFNYNQKHPQCYTPGIKIAFESDIHHTGVTYNFEYIQEFETELETEINEDGV